MPKTVKISIFKTDLPILDPLKKYIKSDKTEDAFHYLTQLMGTLLDEIKQLREQKNYVDDKKERWNQATMRRHMPFYG